MEPDMKYALLSASALAAASIALFGGCSTQGQVSGETMEQATAPLTCMNQSECEVWWVRALVWVTNHSQYKLQTVTDSVIQTAGPSGGKRTLAYQITKTPGKEGAQTIGFQAHCDNMFGCDPNPWKAGADFKQFVRNGAAPAAANANAPVATTPAPSAQTNPAMQPMPLMLESQPGQSGQSLTPQ
jgi:hypothetical protein